MRFVKMHGCGNDYVYINGFREKVRNPARFAIAVSDRHTGVGSDGLILILPSRIADLRMRMFNADGSEGEMCGNGIRCIGKYAYEHGLTRRKSLTVETPGGIVGLELHTRNETVGSVTVDMGEPRPVGGNFLVGAAGTDIMEQRRIALRGGSYTAHVLSMGNPHCVVFIRPNEAGRFERHGPVLESHPLFPSRVNVEFVVVANRRKAVQRTWERGSGETLACGSGACAVTAAAVLTGRTERTIDVCLKGGTLSVEYTKSGRLYMTGPAVEICSGIWP